MRHHRLVSVLEIGTILVGGAAPPILTPPETAALFTAANSESLSMADDPAIKFGAIPWTIGGWVYATALSGIQFLITKRDTPDVDYQMYLSSESVYLTAYNGTTYPQAGAALGGAGNWHLVIGSYNGVDRLSLQVDDGVPVHVAVSGTLSNSTGDLAFGADTGGSQYYFGGRLQHWFLFARPLTLNERTYLYNNGVGRFYDELDADFTTDLRAWWQFDELSGNRTDEQNALVLTDNNTVTSAPGLGF